MKNKKTIDPRHRRRQKAVKALFALSFNQVAQRKKTAPSYPLAEKVAAKIPLIDKIIIKAAPKWPIEKINRIDLAILRLAVWELCFQKKNPPKVIINEAVELAKEYGSENSPSFVNGVLGTIFQQLSSHEEKI